MAFTGGSKLAIRIVLFVTGLATLAYLVGQLLWPFMHSLAWSVIAALVTWPVHVVVNRKSHLSKTGSALLTTVLLTVTFMLAIFPILLELISEAQSAVVALNNVQWSTLVHQLSKVPGIGVTLAESATLLRNDGVANYLLDNQKVAFAVVGQGIKGISQGVVTFFLTIFFTFFLYRDGLSIARQCKSVVVHVAGKNGLKFIATATSALRGAVHGTILTSIVQGLIAAFGYWMFGAPMPVLFGFVTMLFSFIPFGAPMVYLPLAMHLIVTGDTWHQGVMLGIWGAVLVSTADNILRPFFISQTTQMSLLIVFLGIVGGLLQFGILGLFLGPALLAVATSVWVTYVESIGHRTKVNHHSAP